MAVNLMCIELEIVVLITIHEKSKFHMEIIPLIEGYLTIKRHSESLIFKWSLLSSLMEKNGSPYEKKDH